MSCPELDLNTLDDMWWDICEGGNPYDYDEEDEDDDNSE
jgi:hypothetical protein